jgi:nitrate reductase molybdenum cofactor assembly chaperone NarJ/NarW
VAVAEAVHPLKLASLLLGYPSAELRAAAAAASELPIEPAREGQRRRLLEFCRWYAGTDAAELQRLYIEAFDFSKGCSLHLTYHVHGDRRQRGLALLRLKQRYRAAGLEPPGDELPDYLPMLLEFASLLPGGEGTDLLEEHRVSIELVRGSLGREESPFRPLLDAVVDALPRLAQSKLARVRRLAAEGPPHEEVGLEPFAPPEVMPVDDPAAGRPMVGGGGPG